MTGKKRATAAGLKTNRLPTLDIDTAAGWITVRSLSRKEAMTHADKELDSYRAEVELVALAMIDPVMAEDDVREWYSSSPAGEIQNVFHKICELSGMTASAGQDAYKSAGD